MIVVAEKHLLKTRMPENQYKPQIIVERRAVATSKDVGRMTPNPVYSAFMKHLEYVQILDFKILYLQSVISVEKVFIQDE